jgi:hypothetical protein
MAVALDPLLVPPRPWYTVGLDFPTYLPISASFDNVLVVIDHLTQLAHLFPCIENITAEETTKKNYKVCTVYMAFRVFWLVIETRDLSAIFGRHIGDT